MKKIKHVLLFGLLIFGVTNSFGRAKIPFGKKEVINIVSELPDNEMYETSEGSKEYLELATLHEEFNIAWILPLWITQDPKLVLYNEKLETYYEVPEEEIAAILKENNITKEDVLKVPFYNKYGGKIIVLLLVAGIIWSYVGKKEDSVEAKEV
ncbi:hypothetical protein FIA58_007880 [Flavobacterium jejuense]|uniref:Uncharacterized protein n=1 Tax=Flavobacterium jejuense TaxID=1544455 RepID=A0ABX0IPW5_9FLAO|nr:hypothetical protein [Flavobacterium jejuense]NHN25593.1 hypothetical protein [Flavobacterium jejuense]